MSFQDLTLVHDRCESGHKEEKTHLARKYIVYLHDTKDTLGTKMETMQLRNADHEGGHSAQKGTFSMKLDTMQ